MMWRSDILDEIAWSKVLADKSGTVASKVFLGQEQLARLSASVSVVVRWKENKTFVWGMEVIAVSEHTYIKAE
jgi:hypothetical protein